MSDKPFKKHDELIELLEERGIDFSDPNSKSFAKKKLQRIGYYNLINGYSRPFMDSKDTYKPGTTINEIYALYNFDKKLREIFLRHILPIEINIKSLIAYTFPKHHPETNYIVYSNFDTNYKDSHKNITSLISEIQRQIASRASDPCISHYLREHGYVPLWVLNNILTLGTISKFYKQMKQNERQSISKVFEISDKELSSILNYLSAIRNICAHGNRLYCYRNKKKAIVDTKYHQLMDIPYDPSSGYAYGKYDLFALMIIFRILLSRLEFNKLIKSVENALKYLTSKTTILSYNDILSLLGFPIDWKDKLRIRD